MSVLDRVFGRRKPAGPADDYTANVAALAHQRAIAARWIAEPVPMPEMSPCGLNIPAPEDPTICAYCARPLPHGATQ